eukprot:7081593-Lingulodinium_polyedra.AAC.1
MLLFESAHPVVHDLDHPAFVDVELFKVIWSRSDAEASLGQAKQATLLFTMTRESRKRSRAQGSEAADAAALEDDGSDLDEDARSMGGLTEDLEGAMDLD